MSTCKHEARGNQRQSEAISCLSYRGHQRPSETIRCNQAAPQVQSDAIRRNQTQSACPEHCVFRVFVFWAGRKGLCFVFLCFGPAQRACVLCFRVLAAPPQNTAGGQNAIMRRVRSKRARERTNRTWNERSTRTSIIQPPSSQVVSYLTSAQWVHHASTFTLKEWGSNLSSNPVSLS